MRLGEVKLLPRGWVSRTVHFSYKSVLVHVIIDLPVHNNHEFREGVYMGYYMPVRAIESIHPCIYELSVLVSSGLVQSEEACMVHANVLRIGSLVRIQAVAPSELVELPPKTSQVYRRGKLSRDDWSKVLTWAVNLHLHRQVCHHAATCYVYKMHEHIR